MFNVAAWLFVRTGQERVGHTLAWIVLQGNRCWGLETIWMFIMPIETNINYFTVEEAELYVKNKSTYINWGIQQ